MADLNICFNATPHSVVSFCTTFSSYALHSAVIIYFNGVPKAWILQKEILWDTHGSKTFLCVSWHKTRQLFFIDVVTRTGESSSPNLLMAATMHVNFFRNSKFRIKKGKTEKWPTQVPHMSHESFYGYTCKGFACTAVDYKIVQYV